MKLCLKGRFKIIIFIKIINKENENNFIKIKSIIIVKFDLHRYYEFKG
jgi:hypothetical protein